MNQMPPQPNQPAQPGQTPEPDKRVASIVRALALTENGGKLPLDNPSQGQSGEMKSIFQFTPGTWKMYSKQILGKEVPMDKGSETMVAYGKVHNWLQEGFQPEEIASMWNSGKPDAYLQGHTGTNKYGVHYDTPGYVKKFTGYLNQPKEQGSSKPTQAAPQAAPKGGMMQSLISKKQNQGMQNPVSSPSESAPQMKQVRQI